VSTEEDTGSAGEQPVSNRLTNGNKSLFSKPAPQACVFSAIATKIIFS